MESQICTQEADGSSVLTWTSLALVFTFFVAGLHPNTMEADRICVCGGTQNWGANLATIGHNNNRSKKKPCFIPAQDLNPLTQNHTPYQGDNSQHTLHSIHIKTSSYTKILDTPCCKLVYSL